jgi:hypothetical protein
MEIKTCATCKYEDVLGREEPCKSCGDVSTSAKDTDYTNWEPRERQIRLEKRPMILPEPLPIYEHVDSEIPERIRISFTNGTSAVYDLHVDQPAPQVIESIKIIRRMKQGYINQPPTRRRNRK